MGWRGNEWEERGIEREGREKAEGRGMRG